MNLITIDNAKINTGAISKYSILNKQVIATDFNGEKYLLFSAPTEALCKEFLVGLTNSLGATDVNLPVIDFVEVIPKTIEVEVGKLEYTTSKYAGREMEASNFTFSTTDINTAEFVANEILGVKVGSTVGTVRRGAKNDSVAITVVPSKDNIMFDYLSSSHTVGAGYMLQLLENGVRIDYDKLVFISDNPTIATVSERGAVDCLKAGVVIIQALYNGVHYGHALEVRNV